MQTHLSFSLKNLTAPAFLGKDPEVWMNLKKSWFNSVCPYDPPRRIHSYPEWLILVMMVLYSLICSAFDIFNDSEYGRWNRKRSKGIVVELLLIRPKIMDAYAKGLGLNIRPPTIISGVRLFDPFQIVESNVVC